MFSNKQSSTNQGQLVARLIHIRQQSGSQSELISNVNEWFASERITKEQKHQVFTGLYHRHDMYGNLFNMAEMMSMWHLCQMQDYVEPAKDVVVPAKRSLWQSALSLVPSVVDRSYLSVSAV